MPTSGAGSGASDGDVARPLEGGGSRSDIGGNATFGVGALRRGNGEFVADDASRSTRKFGAPLCRGEEATSTLDDGFELGAGAPDEERRDGGATSTSTLSSTADLSRVTGLETGDDRGGTSANISFSVGTAPGTTATNPPLGGRTGGGRRDAGE